MTTLRLIYDLSGLCLLSFAILFAVAQAEPSTLQTAVQSPTYRSSYVRRASAAAAVTSAAVPPACPAACEIGLGVSTAISTGSVFTSGNGILSAGQIQAALVLTAYVSYSTFEGSQYPCIVSTGPQVSLTSALTQVIPTQAPENFHAAAEAAFLSTLSLGTCSVVDQGFYFPKATSTAAVSSQLQTGLEVAVTATSTSAPTESSAPESSTGLSSAAKIGLGVSIGVVSFFAAVAIVLFFWRNKRREMSKASPNKTEAGERLPGMDSKAELAAQHLPEADSKVSYGSADAYEVAAGYVFELDASEKPVEMNGDDSMQEVGKAL